MTEAVATLRQFARLLDVRPSYVTELKNAGRLVLDEAGRVRIEASRKLIRDTEDPSKDAVRVHNAQRRASGRDVAGDAVDAAQDDGEGDPVRDDADPERVSDARRRAKALADKAEIDARTALRDEQVALGALLVRDDVLQAVKTATTSLRSRLENLPVVLSPQLAVERDESRCRVLLADAIEAALTELSRQFAAITRAEDAA